MYASSKILRDINIGMRRGVQFLYQNKVEVEANLFLKNFPYKDFLAKIILT